VPSRCPTWQLQLCVTTPQCLICILPTQHLPCSSRRWRQRWRVIASWVASTAALAFPRGHTRIELGQQRCADRKKSKPNRIEIELWIEKSNRYRSKSIKPNRNITTFFRTRCINNLTTCAIFTSKCQWVTRKNKPYDSKWYHDKFLLHIFTWPTLSNHEASQMLPNTI